MIVFSYFSDTVGWIAEHLESVLQTDHRLAPFRGRMAVVRGTESYEGVTRSDAVFGFVPESSDAPPARSEDLYDILITTDVLAEGMNLQQAGRIINYDLPWNPMRLVQRHGRIDRIGSPHEKVFLTCVFPDRQLEALLALEDRIRRKLAQAHPLGPPSWHPPRLAASARSSARGKGLREVVLASASPLT